MTEALAHDPGLELHRTSNEPSGACQLRFPRTLLCFQTEQRTCCFLTFCKTDINSRWHLRDSASPNIIFSGLWHNTTSAAHTPLLTCDGKIMLLCARGEELIWTMSKAIKQEKLMHITRGLARAFFFVFALLICRAVQIVQNFVVLESTSCY